jgi:hypothetical protein
MAVAKGKLASPTFRDALETLLVLCAVLKSAKTKEMGEGVGGL